MPDGRDKFLVSDMKALREQLLGLGHPTADPSAQSFFCRRCAQFQLNQTLARPVSNITWRISL
jgi:hypothetical protein